MASLACQLDFNEPAALESFVTHRRNLFALNSQLHPVLAQAILRMTELVRRDRAQDLSALAQSLENYRDQSVSLEIDLARVPGFRARDARTRQQVVLTKLRDRLFDISRRNSPLVLLPVRLKKNKGIRDTYALEPLSSVGEINPVVRHQFGQLYNIDLPESIDLETTPLESLYDFLVAKIQASEPAVSLSVIDKPRIDLIHEKAQRRLDQYRRGARVSGRGVRHFGALDYSYDPVNYHPLGIKLFSAKCVRREVICGKSLKTGRAHVRWLCPRGMVPRLK